MSKRVLGIGILVLAFGFVTACVAGESFEEVSKKIAAASEKVQSFSAKSKTITEMKQEGFSMTSTTEGTTEMLRKGDVFLSRMETKSVTENVVAGTTSKQESTMLMINDGAYTYTVSEMGGTKSAFRTKVEKSDADPFKAWRETAELKVLPDESVDGHAVWVIEATPKVAQAAQGKTVIYYHKESGQMIKMVVHTPDGKPMTTTTYSDIKVNEKISPDRFVFKAPPGVEVQDQ